MSGNVKKILALCLLLLVSDVIFAAESLFKVTLLRAAPGNLPVLIEQLKEENKALTRGRIIMRHSQGDHWDLMLLEPQEAGVVPGRHDYNGLVNFQDDFIVKSNDSWPALRKKAAASDLFHIEMFHAAVGKLPALLQQRQMENRYLTATQRKANSIFVTEFGSDVDCFTIGFHQDLQHFATDPDLPEAVFEQAAVAAGFKSRSTIGFRLRETILYHQDTLATNVR